MIPFVVALDLHEVGLEEPRGLDEQPVRGVYDC